MPQANRKLDPNTKVETSPKRLLFIQSTSVLESIGGIEYYLDDLQTDLVKSLGQNQVAALIPQRKPTIGIMDRPYLYERVPFSKTGFWGRVENRFSPTLWKQAVQRIHRTQPTHLVCGHVSLAPLVYLLSLRTGIPYITCTYGIEAWGDLRWLEEHALSQSDCILTISEWTKQILVKRGYVGHQIQVVHPRLPSEFESLLPPVAKGGNRRTLRLITVSRLSKEEKYKGHDHVLQALHRIQIAHGSLPFEYWIVGEGTDLNRLQHLTKALDLQAAVRFIPPVPSRQDLIQFYQQCDLFVMPSRFGKWEGRWKGEGFGIVYLEAAACGLPSVAYNCGGVTDIIQHEKNGVLVTPNEIEELSNSLWNLYLQPERIDLYAQKAYTHVMKNFTRPAIGKEITNWVRTLNSN